MTTTETTTNGSSSPNGAPTLTSVGRVANIPVVNDSINGLHALATSTPLTTKAYTLAEGLVKGSYSLATPVLGYGRPLIEGVDGYANKTLDIAEKKFPYAFQVKSDQLVTDSKNMAGSVYDTRIAPLQGNIIVQRAIDTAYNLNNQVSATYSGGVKKVYDVAGDGQAKFQALIQVLADELAKLQKEGRTLPGTARENVGKAYTDLTAVLTSKDKDTTAKVQEVVAYIQSSVQPLLEGTLRILKTTKEKAEEGADVATEKTKKKAHQGKEAVNGAIDQ